MPTCYGQSDRPEETPVNHFGGQQVVWLKRHTAVIRRGQQARLEVVLRDSHGDPIDISDCLDSGESLSVEGDAPTIAARFCEATSGGGDVFAATGEVITAEEGLVRITPPLEVVNVPGIYVVEVAALAQGETEQIITSQQLCLWVETGLFGNAPNVSRGPPLLSDLRIALRDFTEENELLATVDFDNTELSFALTQPIRDWNESLPRLRRRYTTQNFPYRGAWMAAAAGYLFRTAAEHYRRNKLPYNAGGTAIDDKNKAPEYDARGDGLIQEWRSFVRSQKISDNLAGAYGTLRSGYAFGGW